MGSRRACTAGAGNGRVGFDCSKEEMHDTAGYHLSVAHDGQRSASGIDTAALGIAARRGRLAGRGVAARGTVRHVVYQSYALERQVAPPLLKMPPPSAVARASRR